jgi:hypothetical protein
MPIEMLIVKTAQKVSSGNENSIGRPFMPHSGKELIYILSTS